MLLALAAARTDVAVTEESTAVRERQQALDRFLRGVERRALVMAEISTQSREDALDIVQDAMLVFVRNYADKPAAEWSPLFYRVLDSRILDHHRRSSVRRRFRVWFGKNDEDGEDPLANIPDPREPGPWQQRADDETRAALAEALAELPLRQRQVFLLRIWEGLDVEATASALKVSGGSVKTHLFRALERLRQRLEDWR